MKYLVYFTVSILQLCGVAYTQQLNETALDMIAKLDSLVGVAESHGIDVIKEKMTIRTSEVFLNYANWDEKHVTENTDYFMLAPAYRDNPEQYARNLADYERSEVILMLEGSIAYLNSLLRGTYHRKAVPDVQWAEVDLEGDQLTFENRPVFLVDYTWKPEISELTEYHGQMDGFFITPGDVIDESGQIKANTIDNLLSKTDTALGFIFLNHKNVPQWALDKYGPGFDLGIGLRFTEYDIDNPGAREMQSLLIKGLVPYMAGKNYTGLGYMLCNEPHFYASIDGKKELWASGTVSDYTKEKFRAWLRTKHADIHTLNTLWGSLFPEFDSISIKIPIDLALRGTPMWYDWARFNNDRVNDWYLFLKSEIQKYDPDAKVHLKIMPNLWTENERNHGIDFEALTEMSEIIGNDAGADDSYMWGDMPWKELYAFNWRELFMSYDFLKSVNPDKINFNSESHFLSSNKFRDLYLKPEYVRSVFWSACILGMNVSQIWYWPRLEDGSIKSNAGKGYAGSLIQQPRVVNELHSTIMDLNSHAEEIMAMQRQRKPVRIFYSETSAISKDAHMDDVFEMYENMLFEGVSIGFVTKNIIEKQNPFDWELIIVYKTEYITQLELAALQNYLDSGGTIITDAKSLLWNEYGEPQISLEQGAGQIVQANSLSDIKNKAMAFLEARACMPPVSVKETNTGGAKACFWRWTENDSGKLVLSVVNIGSTSAQLEIDLNSREGTVIAKDLINGIPASTSPLLAPYEVYFVELQDTVYKDTSSTDNVTFQSISVGLYPSSSSGIFKIVFSDLQDSVILNVYNVNGSCVKKIHYMEAKEIEEDLFSKPDGIYLIQVIASGLSKTFPFIKSS